jgi:hypothetical protein
MSLPMSPSRSLPPRGSLPCLSLRLTADGGLRGCVAAGSRLHPTQQCHPGHGVRRAAADRARHHPAHSGRTRPRPHASAEGAVAVAVVVRPRAHWTWSGPGGRPPAGLTQAHRPLRQADPWVDDPAAPLPGAGRPVDLAGAGWLRPAAPGPPAGGRAAAGVGGASPARAAVALPGPQGGSRLLCVLGPPAAARNPQGTPLAAQGPLLWAGHSLPAINNKPAKQPRKKQPTATKAA